MQWTDPQFSSLLANYATVIASAFAVVGIPLALLQLRASRIQHSEASLSEQFISYAELRKDFPDRVIESQFGKWLSSKRDFASLGVGNFVARLTILIGLLERVENQRSWTEYVKVMVITDLRKLFRLCSISFMQYENEAKAIGIVYPHIVLEADGRDPSEIAMNDSRLFSAVFSVLERARKEQIAPEDVELTTAVEQEAQAFVNASRVRSELIRASATAAIIAGLYRKVRGNDDASPLRFDGTLKAWGLRDQSQDAWVLVEGLTEGRHAYS